MAGVLIDPMEQVEQNIIFFDGVCNLCNGFIDFVIKRDTDRKIYYASLQSEFAKDYLAKRNIDMTGDLSTMYLYSINQMHSKSTAILSTLILLGGGWRVLGRIGLFIYKPLRDFIYDKIAGNRYKLFGRKNSCRLPDADEQNQFL
jgi:predicted DCC family thiol-disulfide oxidoreductase YuxK